MIWNVIMSENGTKRKSIYAKCNGYKHRDMRNTKSKLAQLTQDTFNRHALCSSTEVRPKQFQSMTTHTNMLVKEGEKNGVINRAKGSGQVQQNQTHALSSIHSIDNVLMNT